ncbi:hypothetical protein MASR1M90_18390 [Desulfovibrionales bacterium]
MQRISQFVQHVQWMLRSLDIHPFVFAAGAVCCIFFPRFFLLLLLGLGGYWVARNVLGRPARGARRGARRHRK